jgi:hypothetical protein
MALPKVSAVMPVPSEMKKAVRLGMVVGVVKAGQVVGRKEFQAALQRFHGRAAATSPPDGGQRLQWRACCRPTFPPASVP